MFDIEQYYNQVHQMHYYNFHCQTAYLESFFMDIKVTTELKVSLLVAGANKELAEEN